MNHLGCFQANIRSDCMYYGNLWRCFQVRSQTVFTEEGLQTGRCCTRVLSQRIPKHRKGYPIPVLPYQDSMSSLSVRGHSHLEHYHDNIRMIHHTMNNLVEP